MASQLPKTAAEYGIDDVEAHNRRTRAKLQRALDEHTGALNEQQSKALDALMGTGPETATVDFSELTGGEEPVEIEVRTELPGRTERLMDQLARNEFDTIDDAMDAALSVICEVVVAPPEFADRDVWRGVWEERGSTYLSECAELLTKPWFDSMVAVERFRGNG